MQNKDWEQLPFYAGADLGAQYSDTETTFRIWAPDSEGVQIRFYDEGDGNDRPQEEILMEADRDGTFFFRKTGDLSGVYYTYRLKRQGRWTKEITDPYGIACGVNGKRSMVLKPADGIPEGFESDRGPVLENPVDAVITEISVADMTGDPSADNPYPGQFKGLTVTGTRTKNGFPTGLDYLKALGVTHVQILPFFDGATKDEAAPAGTVYNWGYDPMNYNVPEGYYATDPYHGEVRVRECKEMIQAFHRAGIGVIMDVVYNHVYDAGALFEVILPGYFFRKKNGKFLNGSGCGNEVASEHPMVRKYIIDSLCYWAGEYHVDGFRFDLMAILDTDTMNEAARRLRKIKPDILLYGEGWTCGSCGLPEEKQSIKMNVQKLDGIGMFSDNIRDHIKGSVFDDKDTGFINGASWTDEIIKADVTAAVGHPAIKPADWWNPYNYLWNYDPACSINYISCHDNLTFWDKLTLSCPESSEEDKLKMNRLGAAILMTSQGVPFFLSGEECARTKPAADGTLCENSYNQPFSVNSIKYDRAEGYQDLICYYQGLIAFRKSHPLLRLRSREEICSRIRFAERLPKGMVGFFITPEEGISGSILVIYNRGEEKEIRIPRVIVKPGPSPEKWDVYVKGDTAGNQILETVKGKMRIPEKSAWIGVLR